MSNQTELQPTLINLTIDGQAISVPKGKTVYTAAKELGIDLPIFCYQDRMPPFGACRVCLVEVEKMAKLQTSCTLEATEGMIINTQSKMAKDGRKSILEFLLINHPLDCPICDRGGECPLQDQTLKFGPGESRFYEEKRHFTKALPLGPVLMLDRERCIACARCVRFSDIVAGDNALEFIDRGYKTEVGTPGGAPAESKYIGNTIMICPVGALTSQVYRFRARPWDNEPIASTCTLCPVGCSLILDSRDGEIMRTRSKENIDVNDIWLCDKGWFGYEFASHSERLSQPLIRRSGVLQPATWDEALSFITSKFKAAQPAGKLAAFGGNPLTTEENYLFQKLMREGAGVNHIDHRIGHPIIPFDEEGIMPGMEMKIGDVEELSCAFLLGIDLTEEFPVIWLRLRQAINRGAKVISIGHFAPEISSLLSNSIVHAPGKEIEVLSDHLSNLSNFMEKGKKGAFFIGSQYLNSLQRHAILAKLANVQQSHLNLNMNVMEGKNNSLGARMAGMRPDFGPLGERLEAPGLNCLEVLKEASQQGWDLLYVAGANPARKFPSSLWEKARARLGCLIVQDIFLTETAMQADVVLPALSFVEKQGSIVNIEGRVQKLQPGKAIPYDVYSDGEIFKQIAYRLNKILPIDKSFVNQIQSGYFSLTRSVPLERVESSTAVGSNDDELVATFAPALFDRGVRMKKNIQLVQLSKKPFCRIHPNEGFKREIQDGAKAAIIVNSNRIEAEIRHDQRVAQGTIVLPLGFDELPVHELAEQLFNGLRVILKRK